MTLTHADLKRILNYDPETGVFTWKQPSATWLKIGDVAGGVSTRGYIRIQLGGKKYRCHRLAFLYMTGSFPKGLVDHINRNTGDNRWCNLREVDSSQNQYNKSIQRNNTSGTTGVSWHAVNKKWVAKIRVENRTIYLGTFNTLKEAKDARNSAAKKYHKHYARIE